MTTDLLGSWFAGQDERASAIRTFRILDMGKTLQFVVATDSNALGVGPTVLSARAVASSVRSRLRECLWA
jgi:hypothetical protein